MLVCGHRKLPLFLTDFRRENNRTKKGGMHTGERVMPNNTTDYGLKPIRRVQKRKSVQASGYLKFSLLSKELVKNSKLSTK